MLAVFWTIVFKGIKDILGQRKVERKDMDKVKDLASLWIFMVPQLTDIHFQILCKMGRLLMHHCFSY